MNEYIRITFHSLADITRFVKSAKITPAEVLDCDGLSTVYPLYILPYAEKSDFVANVEIIKA